MTLTLNSLPYPSLPQSPVRICPLSRRLLLGTLLSAPRLVLEQSSPQTLEGPRSAAHGRVRRAARAPFGKHPARRGPRKPNVLLPVGNQRDFVGARAFVKDVNGSSCHSGQERAHRLVVAKMNPMEPSPPQSPWGARLLQRHLLGRGLPERRAGCPCYLAI